jgi:phosphonoacetaldehyde hydrolase
MTVRLVVFDWAGTLIDFGCRAPTGAFVEAFATRGIAVTLAEARGPMGLHKKAHIREMLRTPSVGAKWRVEHGRDWTDADVQALYARVTPAQLLAIEPHGGLVPGALEAAAELRKSGIRVGGTTGYFREAAARCHAVAARQGLVTDCNVCADDVPAGRPAPWMVFRVMEALGVFPPTVVVKVGDTVADIDEGRNAGAWSVGVTDTGNEMGLSEDDFAALPTLERDERRAAVRAKLFEAGAHAVIGSVRDVPQLVEEFSRRLCRGERP